MGFILKKWLGFWMMPLSIAVLMLALGLILLWFTRRQTLGKVACTVGLVWLGLVSWNPVGNVLLRPIEQQVPPFESAAQVDFIHVLGSGVASDPSIPLNSHLSPAGMGRLIEGIRIFKAYPDAQLVVSGYKGNNHLSNAKVYQQVAVQMGVPEDSIILFEAPKDTLEEAQAVKTLLSDDSQLVLVTSASHMPRALNLFRGQGLNPIPAPSHYLAKDTEQTNWRFDARGLHKTERAMHETIGTLWSKLRGQM